MSTTIRITSTQGTITDARLQDGVWVCPERPTVENFLNVASDMWRESDKYSPADGDPEYALAAYCADLVGGEVVAYQPEGEEPEVAVL